LDECAFEEELAERKPGRTISVTETEAVISGVVVTVTTLGMGEDLVTRPVDCSVGGLGFLVLTTDVVADSTTESEQVEETTTVTSSVSVPEQVEARASLLTVVSVEQR
jgi:hypothetical protein